MKRSSATKQTQSRIWAAFLLGGVLCSACDPGNPPMAKPLDSDEASPLQTEARPESGGASGPRVTVFTQHNTAPEQAPFPTITPLPESLPRPQTDQVEVRPAAVAAAAIESESPAAVPQVGSLQSPKPIEGTPAADSPPATDAQPVLEAKTKTSTLEVPPPTAKPAPAQPPPAPLFNDLVLKAIRTMPKGGGYALTSAANTGLRKAITISRKKSLDFEPKAAQPSYCSGATYQVFLSSLQSACDRQRIKLDETISKSLLMAGQPDGAGVWGRWNANGPGTARLFYETGIGVNFEDWAYAQPGDFLKIFWNDNIGKREAGHSVVFLALEQTPEKEWQLRFWSSNIPDGYGEKAVPISKIKRVVFSRLTNPSAISAMPALATDEYLKDMLKRDGTPEELAQKTGMAR
ncbi:MAG: hypothetical protein KDK97_21985 [Verrucomicrobiales bacterium]|nr:hypothetical protein [Verrucomicrobiales bacterium]MCP5557985.1 hypothetical protein [Verrucomicrobiaceae bacterium]